LTGRFGLMETISNPFVKDVMLETEWLDSGSAFFGLIVSENTDPGATEKVLA
jgi:hypothetical protein